MKLRKLGVYFIVAMLMISFLFTSREIQAYAEETKTIGIGNLTENDLVSAWYFDEDSGDIVEDYKGNYNGTASGTTIVDTPYGKGRNFDGTDDYIQFNDSVISTGKKSIRFKIRTTQQETAYIVEALEHGSEDKGYSIYIDDGYLGFSFFKGVGGDDNFSLMSSEKINDGQWHDILFSWDGTTDSNSAKLYIDDFSNSDKSTTPEIEERFSYSYNTTVGRLDRYVFNKFQGYFKGELDEIEIYNEVFIPSAAPENLKAAAGDEEVDLSWDEVEDADSYIIKRSTTKGGPYETKIVDIDDNFKETSYIDEDVINGTTYYYVVSAVINGAESPNSNEAYATPQGSSSGGSGDMALLKITMQNGKTNEYDLSIDEVEDFIDWFEDQNDPYYIIEKDYNIGPFESRKDYIVADKISQFEVMEYED